MSLDKRLEEDICRVGISHDAQSRVLREILTRLERIEIHLVNHRDERGDAVWEDMPLEDFEESAGCTTQQ